MNNIKAREILETKLADFGFFGFSNKNPMCAFIYIDKKNPKNNELLHVVESESTKEIFFVHESTLYQACKIDEFLITLKEQFTNDTNNTN